MILRGMNSDSTARGNRNEINRTMTLVIPPVSDTFDCNKPSKLLHTAAGHSHRISHSSGDSLAILARCLPMRLQSEDGWSKGSSQRIPHISSTWVKRLQHHLGLLEQLLPPLRHLYDVGPLPGYGGFSMLLSLSIWSLKSRFYSYWRYSEIRRHFPLKRQFSKFTDPKRRRHTAPQRVTSGSNSGSVRGWSRVECR